MAKLVFRGRVFPTQLNLSWSQPLTLGWTNQGLNFHGEVSLTLTNSAFIAECETNSDDINLVYKEVYELTSAPITLLGFALGHATTIIFDTITTPKEGTTTLFFYDPSLPAKLSALKFDGASMMNILNLAIKEPLIHYALRDLNDCFVPNRVTLNAARVIETVRYMIHPTAEREDREPAWRAMQEALNLSPQYVRFISNQSLSHRHGRFVVVDGATNGEIMDRTWKIFNRFLEFRLRGNQALVEPEFPLLS